MINTGAIPNLYLNIIWFPLLLIFDFWSNNNKYQIVNINITYTY
jgi:hypothetical protein